jgi:OOP family OmpA-OmpF porin
MTPFSAKTAALTAVIAMGFLMSSSAHAAILHTASGTPVLTKDGALVLAGLEGLESCNKGEAAELAAQAEKSRDRVVFFNFNKSDLTGHAKHKLAHLAKRLNKHAEKTITIVGYADRIGNAAYNEKLALNRAKTVHDFLIGLGVKAKKIEVRSLGKSAPKADCAAELPRAEAISCLAADRRVEIEIK